MKFAPGDARWTSINNLILSAQILNHRCRAVVVRQFYFAVDTLHLVVLTFPAVYGPFLGSPPLRQLNSERSGVLPQRAVRVEQWALHWAGRIMRERNLTKLRGRVFASSLLWNRVSRVTWVIVSALNRVKENKSKSEICHAPHGLQRMMQGLNER